MPGPPAVRPRLQIFVPSPGNGEVRPHNRHSPHSAATAGYAMSNRATASACHSNSMPARMFAPSNAKGAANGYIVSTYSPPVSVLAPNGDRAIYTCPARTSDGAYARCDGGICFTSTEGQSFPGFEQPLAKDQIICSCPITV